jgi:hypothetical protein
MSDGQLQWTAERAPAGPIVVLGSGATLGLVTCNTGCALSRGEHTITLEGDDGAGGVASAAITVTVDDLVIEFAESQDQRSCIAALNRRGQAVAVAQGRETVRTVLETIRGAVADPDARLTADPKRRVTAAKAKTTAADSRRCRTAPDFAHAGATAVNDAAQQEKVALVRDLFGPDLSAALVAASIDEATARCQHAVTKASERLAQSSLGRFVACKKAGLTRGTIRSRRDVEACFTEIGADTAGKIGKRAAQLRNVVTDACYGVAMATAFPGACDEAGDFVQCVVDRVQHRLCRTVAAMDDLGLDCGG